jgi:antitoxin (DNA-binding transcriptional repressor) of toxin-antitoxin stability system
VRHGEEIEVTERGRPVAMLVPLPGSRANKLADRTSEPYC